MKEQASYLIFIISNPLSALVAKAIFEEQKGNEIGVFLVDYGNRKQTLINEMKEIVISGKNTVFFNLGSEIGDESNIKPGFRKRVTRQIKHLPLIRSIYKPLQAGVQSRIERQIENKLVQEFSFLNNKNVKKVFLLTQTYTNEVCLQLFPSAEYNYYEHGIGDYVLSGKPTNIPVKSFYGIFANEYRTFIGEKTALNYCPIKFHHISDSSTVGKDVLIIMQNLEIYGLGSDFWNKYLNSIVHESGNEINFIVKPHPLQSQEVKESVRDFFTSRNLKVSFIENSLCIEKEFEKIASLVRAVYSPFSSSVFYLSKMYSDTGIQFKTSIQRVHDVIGNAPQQYKHQFEKSKEIMFKVFGSNCTEF